MNWDVILVEQEAKATDRSAVEEVLAADVRCAQASRGHLLVTCALPEGRGAHKSRRGAPPKVGGLGMWQGYTWCLRIGTLLKQDMEKAMEGGEEVSAEEVERILRSTWGLIPKKHQQCL